MKSFSKTTKVRSKGEMELWEQFPDWGYEPAAIWYSVPYIPDFVTPAGTLIEYKEFLTLDEFQRIKYVNRTLSQQRVCFIVLVLDTKSNAGKWPKKGHNLVAYLQEAGIRSQLCGPGRAATVMAYIRQQEDQLAVSRAKYAGNNTGAG